MHDPPILGTKAITPVESGSIVPDNNIARTPTMAPDELLLGGMVEQFIQQDGMTRQQARDPGTGGAQLYQLGQP